jgi:hypothetical protein
MSGTAIPGSMYSLDGTWGRVTIQAGQTSATVTLTESSAAKKTKTATMMLNAGSGYIVSKPSTASVLLSK